MKFQTMKPVAKIKCVLSFFLPFERKFVNTAINRIQNAGVEENGGAVDQLIPTVYNDLELPSISKPIPQLIRFSLVVLVKIEIFQSNSFNFYATQSIGP